MMNGISILMSVYDGEEHVGEAIKSVLNQSYFNYEFTIINDGSKDRTLEIVRSYKDPRIKVLNNESNIGLTESLNRGLKVASGKYIARMDADDVSHPDRLQKQVEFMDSNPDVGVCGTWVEMIGERSGEVWRYPTNDEAIRCRFLFESVLAHPSVMVRRDLLTNHGATYNPEFKNSQDYDLWVRLAAATRMANIPEVLLHRRLHKKQIGQEGRNNQFLFASSVRAAQLDNLGVEYSPEELELHNALGSWKLENSLDFVTKAEKWLRKLQDANRQHAIYPEPAFSSVLGHRWLIACYRARSLGVWVFKKYFGSPLCHTMPANLREMFYLRTRHLLNRFAH